jgi:hypothetical protein
VLYHLPPSSLLHARTHPHTHTQPLGARLHILLHLLTVYNSLLLRSVSLYLARFFFISRASFRVFLRSLSVSLAQTYARASTHSHTQTGQKHKTSCVGPCSKSVVGKSYAFAAETYKSRDLRFCSRNLLQKQRPLLLQQRPAAEAENSAFAPETFL